MTVGTTDGAFLVQCNHGDMESPAPRNFEGEKGIPQKQKDKNEQQQGFSARANPNLPVCSLSTGEQTPSAS